MKKRKTNDFQKLEIALISLLTRIYKDLITH